jgi:protein disulfide isomerase
VIPFDNSAIEKIFQKDKKLPVLFLFMSDNAESLSAKEAFKELDESGTDLILTFSDPNDGLGLYDRLTEYVGVDGKTTPKVLLLNDKQQKFVLEGAVTKEALSAFIAEVNAGRGKQFLKSAPVPETNDAPVKVAVGSNFKEMVLDSPKEFLVKFYAPWCGHCKSLAPHYEDAAERLSDNPNIVLVKIDSTLNEVAGADIQGFPTLKFYQKDKTQAPLTYDGPRDADGIVSWLKDHTEYEWVEPKGKILEEM